MRGFCSKCIAWLAIFSFLITNHSFVSAQTVLSDKTDGHFAVIQKLEIPANLGTIETQFQASNDSPFVVYIQDAHAIYDAQNNIEALIQFLQKKHGINLVTLEGAEGPLDPLLLRTFPDKFTKRKVLDGYLTHGELTGPEMAAIFNPDRASYEGLENWKVYEENYLVYLEGMKQKDKILKRLTAVREILDRERKTVYTAPMNAFHEQTQAFYDEKSDLMKLLKFLGTYKDRLDSAKHADLAALMGSLEKSALELSKGEEPIEAAVKKMAEGLRKKLSKRDERDEVAELNKNAQSYMTGQIDAGTYLKYLVETGRKMGLRPKLTPRMREVLGEAETLSMIRGSKLFDELEDFLKAVETGLVPGPKEKELAGKYRRLRLLGALAKLELTTEQLAEYGKEPAAYFDLYRLGTDLKTQGRTAAADAPEELLAAIEFYRLARERDEIFRYRLAGLMKERKVSAAVVVTGGFHKAGFEKELREAGYSYAIVMPKIDSLNGNQMYEPVMRGDFSYRKYLESSFYRAFMRAASVNLVSGLGDSDFKRILKQWRDDVIRELAARKEISRAGEYTSFIDALTKVYLEKFNDPNQIEFKREEILRAVDDELKDFKKNTAGEMWRTFGAQFKEFVRGLKDLADRKTVTAENVGSLIRKSSAVKPNTLSTVLALARGSESRRIAGAMAGSIDTTVRRQENPYALAPRETYEAAVKGVGAPEELVQRPEIRAEAGKLAPVMTAAKGREVSAGPSEVLTGLETGAKAALEKIGPVNAEPVVVAAAIVEAAKNLSESNPEREKSIRRDGEGPLLTRPEIGGKEREEMRAEEPRPEAAAATAQSESSFETLDQRIRKEIVIALAFFDGNRAEAAKRLGISERTIYREIQKYQIGKEEYQGKKIDVSPQPIAEVERIAIADALAVYGKAEKAYAALGMSPRTYFRRMAEYRSESAEQKPAEALQKGHSPESAGFSADRPEMREGASTEAKEIAKEIKDLPPLPVGDVPLMRLVHITGPEGAQFIRENGGLDYSRYGMLSSTARWWLNPADVGFYSDDPRFSGEGKVAVVMDVPASEVRLHANMLRAPGKVPLKYLVGVVPAERPEKNFLSRLTENTKFGEAVDLREVRRAMDTGDPQGLLAALKKDPWIRRYFEQAYQGEDRYLENHTLKVMDNIQTFIRPEHLPAGFGKPLFLLMGALHDLGKTEALDSGTRIYQNRFTLPMIRALSAHLPVSADEIEFILAFLNGDPIGFYMENPIPERLESSVLKLEEMYRPVAGKVSPQDFFQLVTDYALVDGAAYPVMAKHFEVDQANHRLDFSPASRKLLEQLKTKFLSETKGVKTIESGTPSKSAGFSVQRQELRGGDLLEYVAMGIGTYFVLNAALRTAGVRARAWKADWDAGWLTKVKSEIDRDLAADREPKRTNWWRYKETFSEILKLAERYRPVFEKTLAGGITTLDEQNGVKAYRAAGEAFVSYLDAISFYARRYIDARQSDLLPLRSGEYWDQLSRLLELLEGLDDDRLIQTARQVLEESILRFENIRKQEPELLAAFQKVRQTLSSRSELRLSDYRIKREAIEGPEYWDRNFAGRAIRLDIGAGSGYPAIQIARAVSSEAQATESPAAVIVGVDLPAGPQLTEARTLAADRGMLLQSETPPLENLKFVEADVRELLAGGFRENQIDAMYLFFPYTDPAVVGDQYLKPDEPEFWNLVVSRLKPGGQLHLITDNAGYAEILKRHLQESQSSAVEVVEKPLSEKPPVFPNSFKSSHGKFAAMARAYLVVTKNLSAQNRAEMRAETNVSATGKHPGTGRPEMRAEEEGFGPGAYGSEGMPLENPAPVAKGPMTDLVQIMTAVKSKSEALQVNGTTVYFDNDLLDQFKTAGFKTREEFLESLNKLVTGELSLNPAVSKEIVVSLLDGAGNLIEDHRGRGFIGVHRSLFEKLSGLPKTARTLLTIGLRHGLAHESVFAERKVLVEHFRKTRQARFGEAARLADQFIRDHAEDLKSALQAEGLWELVEKRLLDRDLETAEDFALDARQLIERKLLPATAPFVGRYLQEGRSAFSIALEDNLEVEEAKHGFVDPSHPVYRQINGLFQKVVRAAGLEEENIQLYLINSDEVNAYWVTDSRSFFVSLGFVKAFRRYLSEQNFELTQDAVQFVLAHEVRHLVQHLVSKDRLVPEESKDRRAITRNREYDADIGGIFLASYAGANPRAAIACLRFLDALGGIPFLTDHPLGDERVGEVQKILQSPDQFLPNIGKEEQVFSQEFLTDSLIREPTRAAAFYERLMAAKSLEDIAGQIDAIEDPALLEEFLDYYYLNMAFRFSTGLMRDPAFRRHMAFLLVANNLSEIINAIGMSSKVSNPQYVFDREWKVPTTIAPLFRLFQSSQKSEEMSPISILGPSLAESQKAILDYLEKAIEESISNLGDDEGDWKKEHHLPVLQALQKNLRAILNEALAADVGVASVSRGEDKRFVAEKIFPDLATAKAELGEMIVGSRERRDGILVSYLDTNAILTNFEGFWKFFENLYDRTAVERWQSRGKQAEGIRMLGLKEWFRKGWGKMELPKMLFELEVDQFGDFDDARKAEIGQSRAQFLEIYMRFLAFQFFMDSPGPYAGKPMPGIPAVPHADRIFAKINKMAVRQYGSMLGPEGLELTALVRYEAIFCNQIPDYDERLERLIRSLSAEELEKVSQILMSQPPYQLSSMPAPVAGMVEYGHYFGEIQKRFVSHYFEVLQKILTRKAGEGGLDLEEINRLVTLRGKFTLRFESDAAQSEGFKKALFFVFGSLLSGREKESLDLIFGEIGATGDIALKDLLFEYLNETYFAANDYQPRIDALVRLYPARSEVRNRQVEAIFKMIKNYETMTDAEKKAFLEKLLPQFKTDAGELYHVDEEDQSLHQKLSRDYMLLLKKEGMGLEDMIRKMDEVGAVPVLFDLIFHNYDAWRNLSFEGARRIVAFIKQSKSGYKSYQMVIGAAALSKSVPGFPTFYRTPDTRGDNVVRTMPDGSRKRVNAYEYELKQKGDYKDFHGYLSNLIRDRDSLPFLAGRSFETMVSLIIELIPVSEERDALLRNLYQLRKPPVAQAPLVLQGFSPLQDKGEMVNLAPIGGGYVNDYMIFEYLGIRDVLRQVGGRKDSPEEVDRAYDVDKIMAKIRAHIPDHLKGDAKARQALTRLETNLRAHHAELKKAVLIPHDTTQFGWQESIRKEIAEFAFENLIAANPAFDYFNLRDFVYRHDKSFEVIWKIYLAKKSYFFDESIPLKDRLVELMRLFPEKTPLRDNLLWNLSAMEESRLAGVPHSQRIVFLNMLSLDYEPFEIVEPEGLDFGRLTADQARQLVDFYKAMMPTLTEGSRQIVLGRKIYELEKRYFPQMLSDFDNGLREILEVFPKFSLARDSILNEFTAGGAVKTYPQLLEVRKYILEEQRLATEKEIVRDSRWDDLWKLAQALTSRAEKADLLLWLLNPSRPLPESLRKLANSQHVNFDSLPGLVFSLTRGEREKFFHDALRGRNGLFEVETLPDEVIAGLRARLIAERDNILAEILKGNPKAKREQLLGAFKNFERNQSFETLSALMEVLAAEAGEAEPRAMLSAALDAMKGRDSSYLTGLRDLLGPEATFEGTVKKISGEISHIQGTLAQMELLLRVSTKIGVGKTLQANIERLRRVTGSVESLRPMAGEIEQALEALRDIQPGKIESMQVLMSAVRDKMRILDQLSRSGKKEEVRELLREIEALYSEVETMRGEIDRLKKALAVVERIGLFRGSSEKLEQLDWLLARAGDESTREFIRAIRQVSGKLFGEEGASALEVVRATRERIGQQAVLDRFVDGLFEDIFKGDDLGRGRGILKDAFKSIFMGYSTERRIFMFNALMNVFSSKENRSASRAAKIKIMLEQMGVAGVKVAQFLSEQDQLFRDAPDVQDALRELKKDAASFHLRAVFQLLQEAGLLDRVVSLGDRLGAASIKMVYELFLKNELTPGEIDRVAAKFLRPAAEKFLAEDIAVLDKTVRRLNEKYPDLGLPASMVGDIQKMILEELKFEREAANARQFKEHLDARAPPAESEFEIRVPQIFHQSDYVILEEIVQGITLEDLILLRSDPGALSDEKRAKRAKLKERLTPEDYQVYMDYDLEAIHKAIGREFFHEAFGERFFHADLHFGNAMITPRREIYMIDLGAVGQMDQEAMQGMLKLTVALASGNASMGLKLLNTMLERKTSSNRALQRAIRDLIASDLPMDDKLNQLIQLIQKNNLGANPNLVVYLKALAAVAPSLEHLSEEEKAVLVRRYLSASSKWSVGWNMLISKLFGGKPKGVKQAPPVLPGRQEMRAETNVSATGKHPGTGRPEMRSELRSGADEPTTLTGVRLPLSSDELAERIKKYDVDVSDQVVARGNFPGLPAGAAVARIKNLRNRSYQDRILQKEVSASMEDGRVISGRLFVVLDGYNGNAEMAQLVQYLTLDEGLFERALLRARGDAREAIRLYVGEVEQHAIRYNNDRYSQERVPGTTVSLAFVTPEPEGKIRVDTGVLGDSPLLIFGPADGLGNRGEIYRAPKHSIGPRLFESIGGRTQTAGERVSVPATDSKIVDRDSVLILASDGVVAKGPDVVLAPTPLEYSDDQVRLVREAVHRLKDAKEIAEDIVQSARNGGQRDDITAVVVRLDRDGLVPKGPGPASGRAELRAGEDLRPNRRDFLRIGTALMTSGLLSAAGCVVSQRPWRPSGKLIGREVDSGSLTEWYEDKDGTVTVFITDEIRQAEPLLDELRRIIQTESLRGGPVAKAVSEQMRKLADNPVVKLIDKMQGHYDVANFILSSLADKDSLLRQAAAFALVAASAQNPVAAAAIIAVLDIALQDGGLEDLWSEGNARQILAKVLKAYLRTQKLDQLAPLADIVANPEAADAILKSMLRLNPEQLKRLSQSLEKLLARNGVDYERMRRKVEALEAPAERVLKKLDPDFRGLPKLPATSDVLERILNQAGAGQGMPYIPPVDSEVRMELRGVSVAGDLSRFQKNVGDLATAASIAPQSPQGKLFLIFSGFGKVTDAGMKTELFDQFIDSVRTHRLEEWTRENSSLNYYGPEDGGLISALIRADYFQSSAFERLVWNLTGLDWPSLDPRLQDEFKEIYRRVRASAEQNIREAVEDFEKGNLPSRKIKIPLWRQVLFKAENEMRNTLVAVAVSASLSAAFFNLRQTVFAAVAGGLSGLALTFFLRVARQKVKDLLKPLRRKIEEGIHIQENIYQKSLRSYVLGIDGRRYAAERKTYEADGLRVEEEVRKRLTREMGLPQLYERIRQMGPRAAARGDGDYMRLEEQIASSEAEIEGQVKLLREIFRLTEEVFGDRLWNPMDSRSVCKITQAMATVKALLEREPEGALVEPICLSLLAMMMEARFPLADNSRKILELITRGIARLKAGSPAGFWAGMRLDALLRQVREFSAASYKAGFVASELAPGRGTAWENLPWLESFRLRKMTLPEKIKYQTDFLEGVRQLVEGKAPQEALKILSGYSSGDMFNLSNLRASLEAGNGLSPLADLNGNGSIPVYAQRVVTIARQWKAVVFQDLLAKDEFASIRPVLGRWVEAIDRETAAIEKAIGNLPPMRQELRNLEDNLGVFLRASERILESLEERQTAAEEQGGENAEILGDLNERLRTAALPIPPGGSAAGPFDGLSRSELRSEAASESGQGAVREDFFEQGRNAGGQSRQELRSETNVSDTGKNLETRRFEMRSDEVGEALLGIGRSLGPSYDQTIRNQIETWEAQLTGSERQEINLALAEARRRLAEVRPDIAERLVRGFFWQLAIVRGEGARAYSIRGEDQGGLPSDASKWGGFIGQKIRALLDTPRPLTEDPETRQQLERYELDPDARTVKAGGRVLVWDREAKKLSEGEIEVSVDLSVRVTREGLEIPIPGHEEAISLAEANQMLGQNIFVLKNRSELRDEEPGEAALWQHLARQGDLASLSFPPLDEKAFVEALAQGKVVALYVKPEALTGDLAKDFALIHNELHALEYSLQMAFAAPAGMRTIKTFGDSVSFPVREALKNAFVHGNKLDFTKPLYLQFLLSGKMSGKRPVVTAIRVFDTASTAEISEPVMELAKQMQLIGEEKGFLWTDYIGWVEQILPIDDLRHGRVGTEVVFTPRRRAEIRREAERAERLSGTPRQGRAEMRNVDGILETFTQRLANAEKKFDQGLARQAIYAFSQDVKEAGIKREDLEPGWDAKIKVLILNIAQMTEPSDALTWGNIEDTDFYRNAMEAIHNALTPEKKIDAQESILQAIRAGLREADKVGLEGVGQVLDVRQIAQRLPNDKVKDALAEKIMALMREHYPDFPQGSMRDWVKSFFDNRKLDQNEYLYILADENGHFYGYLQFGFKRKDSVGKMNYIGVEKSLQKQGIGSFLMDVFFAKLKDRNLDFAEWTALDESDKFYRAYLKASGMVEGEDYKIVTEHPEEKIGPLFRVWNIDKIPTFGAGRQEMRIVEGPRKERLHEAAKSPERSNVLTGQVTPGERAELRTETSSPIVPLAPRAEREDALVRTLGSALLLLSRNEKLKDTLPSYEELDTSSLRESAKVIIASHHAEHSLGDSLEFMLAIPPEQYRALLANRPPIRLLSLDTLGEAYQKALERGAIPLRDMSFLEDSAGQAPKKYSLLEILNHSLSRYGMSGITDFDSHEFSAENWILLGLKWGLLSMTVPSGSAWFGLFDAQGKVGVYVKGYAPESFDENLDQNWLGHTHGVYAPNYMFGPSPTDIEVVMSKAILEAEASAGQGTAGGYRRHYSEFVLTELPGAKPSFDFRILRVDIEGPSREESLVKLSQYRFTEAGWVEDESSLLENKEDLPDEFFRPVPFPVMREKIAGIREEGNETLGRLHEQALQEALPIVLAEHNGNLLMSIGLIPLVYSYDGSGLDAPKQDPSGGLSRQELRAGDESAARRNLMVSTQLNGSELDVPNQGPPGVLRQISLPASNFQLSTYLNAPVIVQIFSEDGKQGLKIYLAEVWARALADRNRLMTNFDRLSGDLHELKTLQLFDVPTLRGVIGKRLESPYGDMFSNELSESISQAAVMALVFGLGIREIGAAGRAEMPDPAKVREALTLLDHPDILAKAYAEKFGKPLVLGDQSQLVIHSGLLDDQYALMKQAMLSIAHRVGIMTPVGTEIKLSELVKMAPDIFQLIPLRPGAPVTPSTLSRKGFDLKSGRIVMWVEAGVPFDFSSDQELAARLKENSFAVQNDVARAMAEHAMSPSERVGLLNLFEAAEFRGKLQEMPGSVFLVMTMDTFEAGLEMLLTLWQTEAATELRVKAAA